MHDVCVWGGGGVGLVSNNNTLVLAPNMIGVMRPLSVLTAILMST